VRWNEKTGEDIQYPIKVYPDHIKPVFHKWLREHYWPDKFIAYAKREYKGEIRVQAVGEAQKIAQTLTAKNEHLLLSPETIKRRRAPKSRRNAS
jgi:hypothetical protein